MMHRKKIYDAFADVQADPKNIILKEGNCKTVKPHMSVEQIHVWQNCESQYSTEILLFSGSGKTCCQCTPET